MVQGFAAQSGGAVHISSSLGKGTTVEMWLPRAEGQLTASVSAEPGELVREQRRARILVCDDDVDVCSLVGTLLRELGHIPRVRADSAVYQPLGCASRPARGPPGG